MEKDKKTLNLSSLTTCDPSSNTKRKKTLKKLDLPLKPFKKIPKNTPQSSKAASLIHSSPIFNSFNFISNLSSESIQELTSFKDQKIEEYKKTLETCLNESNLVSPKQSPYQKSKQERLKTSNQRADKKRQDLSHQREYTELQRLKQSQSMKLSNLYYTMSKKNEKEKRKNLVNEKVQKEKVRKEKRRTELEQKFLVKENIKNFYNDKIEEARKNIEDEKIRSKTLRFEKKRTEYLEKTEEKMKKKRVNKNFFYLV